MASSTATRQIFGTVVALILGACSPSAQSPTAPELEKSLLPASSSAAADAAVDETAERPRGARLAGRTANGGPAAEPAAEGLVAVVEAGGGNGGGNGGGGQSPLSAQLQPDVWNTNFEHSSGTVSARIEGSGVADIDASSIVLVGTDGAEAPLPAQRVQRSGKQLRAFFGMAGALDTLDTPTRGETHVVTIRFTAGTQTVELTDSVRIVGAAADDDDDDTEEDEAISLTVQPDSWNTNWAGSSGTVSALLRGSGLGDIDLTSIFLVGTDPAAAPLAALRAQRSGNHVRAFFAKSAALATLDTPTKGETHEITLRFTAAGIATEATDQIRIVGSAN